MSWWELPRVPEPEAMEEDTEVDAYAAGAVQAYLDRIDDTFVEHVLRLGVRRGCALDVGTGPGQIPLKLAQRLPELSLVGVDRSATMLARAARQVAIAGLASRVRFARADATRLPFTDDGFDLVICNSVLHHLARPTDALRELVRVARPAGALLLRDLRRPSRLGFPLHARWYGRHYTGKMRELYEASLRSAYTTKELGDLLEQARLDGMRVFRFRRTHIGLERAAAPAGERVDLGASGTR